MLKLKFQYFGHLIQRADSSEKNLMLGKIEGRRKGRQKMRWLESITNSMRMSLSKLWKMVKNMKAWHAAATGHKESDMIERLNNNSQPTNNVIVSGEQQSDQPYIYIYPLSPKFPSHPGCHIALAYIVLVG